MGTEPAGPEPLAAVCLVRDLMFVGRIMAVARAAGVAVTVVRDPARLPAADGPKLIVDLNQDAALPAAVAWRARCGRPVIGFVAHVDAATIAAARAAGIDLVLARSAFVTRLPGLLGSESAGNGPEDVSKR